mmetsp:Transcript_21267/g.54461  ORF Transcript_21267/g.54461 Transcript_21267/m.54461 type:complete len:271 (+) Transcript_21267:831-1643(+)
MRPRRLHADQLVEQHAEGECVHLARDLGLLCPLLRRHVRVGAATQPVAKGREPEVAQLGHAIRGEQHIPRLEVLVHDALGLEVPQPRSDAGRDVRLIIRRQRAGTLPGIERPPQIAPGNELRHEQPGAIRSTGHAVKVHHVKVGDFGEHLCLREERVAPPLEHVSGVVVHLLDRHSHALPAALVHAPEATGTHLAPERHVLEHRRVASRDLELRVESDVNGMRRQVRRGHTRVTLRFKGMHKGLQVFHGASHRKAPSALWVPAYAKAAGW